jgi:hypothetical protein
MKSGDKLWEDEHDADNRDDHGNEREAEDYYSHKKEHCTETVDKTIDTCDTTPVDKWLYIGCYVDALSP